MRTLDQIRETYLSSQSLFSEGLNEKKIPKGFGQIGFMTCEACLLLSETSNPRFAKVVDTLANVFETLGRRQTMEDGIPENVVQACMACEYATLELMVILQNCPEERTR